MKKILKVSLVGKTNAGKSTLINSLIGEKISIENKKINTTEDLISGIINKNECQIIVYDTPGLNFIKDKEKTNKKLKVNLWEGLNKCDLILYIIDSKKYDFNEVINNYKKIEETGKKISIAFNKIDLIENKILLPRIKEINDILNIDNFFIISAKKTKGISNLIEYFIKNSYASHWLFKKDEISDKDELFISNECTRNSILSLIHQEIPYNLKVNNIDFKYLKNGGIKIKQEITIYNKRYKKIILGKNGLKIKEIRLKSQKEISNIFKKKIHLYLKLI